ncbi:MAG: hypothetical protein CM1200mP30_31600 [Pseudomonadota bacterium]|nr:MAG: hypothetical protein CM1200mP30_31600 [Pseudomonadota bacterium]
MDAWTFIPFMMIMLLAGLQALSKEVNEAAKIEEHGVAAFLENYLSAYATCKHNYNCNKNYF